MTTWILNRCFGVFCFKKSWCVACSHDHRSFCTEPGWQENFWMHWFFWLLAISQVFPPASFFYFRKFLQCLWSFHLPLVDSNLYPGAPFCCGAFAFFHMMLAPCYRRKSRQALGYEPAAIHLNSEMFTVELLYNGHLGDRRNWPFVDKF